jgi:DNA-binding response OmpR family regulator
VLLAEHDTNAAHQLLLRLNEHQVDVTVSNDGADALLRVGTESPDILIVSASLPIVGGSALVAALRRSHDLPIIVGVGDDDAHEAVAALAAGATACIARPYRIPELLTLLRAIEGSHAAQTGDETLILGDITLNLAAHAVCVRGRRVDLRLRELQLLRFLMLHADRVVTHAEIREHVWGNKVGASNSIAVHIRRLRERLGDDPGNPRLLVSVRGFGYRLTVSPQRPGKGSYGQARPRPQLRTP